MTSVAGPSGTGAVYQITLAGALRVLYSFAGNTDGQQPIGGLIQGANGNLYGTTAGGGIPMQFGTVFTITTAGVLTTLHQFNNLDGAFPTSGVIQATDGNFYGTTSEGGEFNYGTIYRMAPTGELTTLYNFSYTDGAFPMGLCFRPQMEIYTAQQSRVGPRMEAARSSRSRDRGAHYSRDLRSAVGGLAVRRIDSGD